MRVLHVVQKFSSGVGTAIAQYSRSLPTAEHHLLSGTPVDAEGDLDRQGDFRSVQLMSGGHVQRVRRVREVIGELRPDVVHAHSSHGGGYTRLAVSRRAHRVVYSPHCYAFERRDVSVPVRVAFWCAEALLALNTSAFATCSTRELELSAWPTRRAPRYLVPHLVPADRPPHPPSCPDLIAGGGRLGPQKDPAFFVSAVARLRRERPGIRAVWLGDGPEAERRLLTTADVEVTGWLDRPALLDRLGAAGLYLHSARWEGFPLMVTEATALGVPTLVRRLPCFAGIPAGLTIAGPDDVAGALACVTDPAAAAANRAGWAEVLREHTPEEQGAALAAVYSGARDREAR